MRLFNTEQSGDSRIIVAKLRPICKSQLVSMPSYRITVVSFGSWFGQTKKY